MIAGVMCVLDEADIVGDCIEHHLAEGVDRIYAAVGPCVDHTLEILRSYSEVRTISYDDQIFDQRAWINRMAAWAGTGDGAEWVVPFDADEFWVSGCQTKLADYLAAEPLSTTRVVFEWRHHRDWFHTFDEDEEKLPKVAFRWSQHATIGIGNHTVSGAPGRYIQDGAVAHHLRFRSFTQFARKARRACERLPPEEQAQGFGWHLTRYAGMDNVELLHAYDEWFARPAHDDPIPLRR